jgi:flagellar biogenesis protein FliO
MRFALVTLAVLVPAIAHAQVSFEVADHGDSVEVIAHNIEARSTNISAVRSRIEIPITGSPIAARTPMTDSTVLFAELDGHSLSVKTRLDHPEVTKLATLAKAEQNGTDLHLTFPRHAAIEVAKPVEAPKPVEAAKPVVKPEPAPVVVEKKPDIKQAQAALAAATTNAAPAAKIEPAKPIGKPIPAEQPTTLSSPALYGVGALVTLLLCGYLLKKRKKADAAASTIDVIAQRSLGSKAKVMWLSAGGRELLVSVTNSNVRMLGQWSKTDRDALPRAATLGRNSFQNELDSAEAEPVPPPIQSSAVSGILKLRARTSAPLIGRAPTIPSLPKVNEDVATEDAEADLEWAMEILTASGVRR